MKRGISNPSITLVLVVLSLIAVAFLTLPLASVVWMKEGDSLNVLATYEGASRMASVKLVDIAGANNRTKLCGFMIDGEQIWVKEGDDGLLNGVKIYVRKVVSVRDQLQDQDVCKVAFAGSIIKIVKANESEASGENISPEAKAPEENISAASNPEENTSSIAGLPGQEEQQEAVEEGISREVAEEKPVKIGLFSRFMAWLKSLFLFSNGRIPLPLGSG